MMRVLLKRKSLNSLANQQCKIRKRSKRKWCLYDEVMSSRHSPSLHTLKDIAFAEDFPVCFLRSLLTISVLVDRYNAALSSALDGDAPLVTRTFPSRPLMP